MRHFSGETSLFNVSNLHVGGGVQVATSVLLEWLELPELPKGLTVWASSEVYNNLKTLGGDVTRFEDFEVFNTYGLGALFSPRVWRVTRFSRVFTLFGPLYCLWPIRYSITGFAQFWILQPSNEISRSLRWSARFMMRLKFSIQESFFRRADLLVVELKHVADGLMLKGIAKPSKTRVIHNCASAIYEMPKRWEPLPSQALWRPEAIKIGFVGRNYPHKNTSILPRVAELLRLHYHLNVDFYVTFSEEEWSSCSGDFRSVIRNVGSLNVAQCPTFYKMMDGIIFPSLLECFSATPLEALVMEKPLFASDRSFNRDVCGEYAHYFDPVSAESAASVIAGYFSDPSDKIARLRAGKEHARGFSNSRDRALKCLALLSPSSVQCEGLDCV